MTLWLEAFSPSTAQWKRALSICTRAQGKTPAGQQVPHLAIALCSTPGQKSQTQQQDPAAWLAVRWIL